MCNSMDIKDRLEELKTRSYNKDHQLDDRSNLQRFKPSKHKKAYKIDKNFKNRCYAR